MQPTNVSLETIEDFLAQKRIAIVGISRKPYEISTMLLKELSRRGYDVLPVNPNTSEIAGKRCYARVQEIQPAPDVALMLTSPSVTESAVRDCAEAGIKKVWLYRGGGTGATTPAALDYCREHGIEVVPGQCPFMFLRPVRGIHWIHKFLFKITGKHPRHCNT